ncbi:hypothetical protein [Paenibacillus sp. GCM10027626]|uniref:hypothetical protein n=1 Tax=Paenibacillus sp. GCM10027626 TaxID=3273411 RepID=UPI00363596FD
MRTKYILVIFVLLLTSLCVAAFYHFIDNKKVLDADIAALKLQTLNQETWSFIGKEIKEKSVIQDFVGTINRGTMLKGQPKATMPHYMIIAIDSESNEIPISIWINNSSNMFEVNDTYYEFAKKDIEGVKNLIHRFLDNSFTEPIPPVERYI